MILVLARCLTSRAGKLAALCTGILAPGAGLALAAPAGPTISTNRGCYLVGQSVALTGAGFATNRQYVVALDGLYFGASTTDANGAFSAPLRPGGLGAGAAQRVVHLDASDGTSTAATMFTVTRQPGGRFLAASGNPRTLRAPFEIWGFGLDGSRQTVYLHYISPAGRARMSVSLGLAVGQCGYLRTKRRRVFPFFPSLGNWTLQLDTKASYLPHPSGPVAVIRVLVRAG